MKLLSIFKAIAGLVLVGSATAESDMTKHAITGQYIVVFDETMVINATDKALRMIRANGTPDETKILWSYRTALQGVTMSGVDDRMLEAFEGDPEVKYYEQVSRRRYVSFILVFSLSAGRLHVSLVLR